MTTIHPIVDFATATLYNSAMTSEMRSNRKYYPGDYCNPESYINLAKTEKDLYFRRNLVLESLFTPLAKLLHNRLLPSEEYQMLLPPSQLSGNKTERSSYSTRQKYKLRIFLTDIPLIEAAEFI